MADKGVPVPGMAAAKDLAGKPRLVGAAIDFGCYERQPKTGAMVLVR